MYIVEKPYGELFNIITTNATETLKKVKQKGVFSLKASSVMEDFFPIMDLILSVEEKNKQTEGVECYYITPGSESIIWRGYENEEVVHREVNRFLRFKYFWDITILKDNVNPQRTTIHIYFNIEGVLFLVTGIYLLMRTNKSIFEKKFKK